MRKSSLKWRILSLLTMVLLPAVVEAKGGRGGRGRSVIKIQPASTTPAANGLHAQSSPSTQIKSEPATVATPKVDFFNDWNGKKAQTLPEKTIDPELSRASFEAAQARQLATVVKPISVRPGRESVTTSAAKEPRSHTASECKPGMVWQAGQCVVLTVPANAHLNYQGNGWECASGYRANGGACHKIEVPANAVLNFRGDDWKCNKGYQRSGEQCI